MTDFWYSVADAIVWTFKHVLEPLGNFPNLIFSIMMIGGMFYWIFVVQKKYTKKAKDAGGLV